jgi:hypothetical protein
VSLILRLLLMKYGSIEHGALARVNCQLKKPQFGAGRLAAKFY